MQKQATTKMGTKEAKYHQKTRKNDYRECSGQFDVFITTVSFEIFFIIIESFEIVFIVICAREKKVDQSSTLCLKKE